MNKEIWKDVVGYKGLYKVSNMGNVKSLNYARSGKQKNLKNCLDKGGYHMVSLMRRGNKSTRKVHQLVAESFLGHVRCGTELVVNHKDFNRINNNIENIEIVTARENTNRKHLKSSSKYTGISWHTLRGKWRSSIRINGDKKELGMFTREIDAHKAYQKELKAILQGIQS